MITKNYILQPRSNLKPEKKSKHIKISSPIKSKFIFYYLQVPSFFFHEINSQPKEVVEISNRTVYSCVISPMFPIYLHKNGCANYFGHLKSFEDCQALYKHTYKRASIFSLWCGF